MTNQSISGVNSGNNAATLNPQPAQARPGSDSTAVAGQSSAVSAAPAAQTAEPSFAEVRQAASDVQKIIQTKSDHLQFAVDHDQDSGKSVVKLIDKQSGDVILQLPSKQMVAIAQEIDKLVGVFVRQKA